MSLRFGDKLGIIANESLPDKSLSSISLGNAQWNPETASTAEEQELSNKNRFNVKIIHFLTIVITLLVASLVALPFYYYYSEVKICTSTECVRSASILKQTMNASADPCENFYQFTCGAWSDEAPVGNWYSRSTIFKDINRNLLRETLIMLAANSTDSDPRPMKQARQMYQTCLDTDAMDKLGYAPVHKYLHKVYLPQVPKYFTQQFTSDEEYEFDWVRSVANIKRLFAWDIFLGFGVYPDSENGTKNVLYFGTPFEVTPLPKFFTQVSHQKYSNLMKGIFDRIVENTTELSEDYEERIENIAFTVGDINKYITELKNDTPDENGPYRLTVNDLQNITNEYLLLQGQPKMDIYGPYLKELYKNVKDSPLALDGTDIVYVYPSELQYLLEIVNYLSSTPDSLIEILLWTKVTNSLALSTTADIRQFLTTDLFSVKLQKPREIDCANMVTKYMGMAVSYGIAQKVFTDSMDDTQFTKMLKDVRSGFARRLEKLDWIPKDVKDEFNKNSRELLSFIGLPDWLLNGKVLEDYYGEVAISEDRHLENMMAIIKRYVEDKLSSVNGRNDISSDLNPMIISPFSFQAEYSLSIPLAVLNFPVFDLGAKVLNYAAIGSVTDYDQSHNFDNKGIKYYKYGNWAQWWDNKAIERITNAGTCLLDQYYNTTIPNMQLNAEYVQNAEYVTTTLKQNLVDNDGFSLSYNAYKNYISRVGPDMKLPGFQHYTDDQMFFIALGNNWCDRSPQFFVKEGDDQIPDDVRLSVLLQNSKEFAEAFKCSAGSTMNPDKSRCNLW